MAVRKSHAKKSSHRVARSKGKRKSHIGLHEAGMKKAPRHHRRKTSRVKKRKSYRAKKR